MTQLSFKASRLAIRNSVTRIPFRYGQACLTACPQAVMEACIEVGGRLVRGYSADCLPPSWFDKSPEKSYSQQIEEMLAAISLAERHFSDQFAAVSQQLFPGWLVAQSQAHDEAEAAGFPPLLASFGTSMVERALLDGLCRAFEMPFAAAVRNNLPGIQAEQVHPALAGLAPADWLPARPSERIHVRHTVGLADPLTAADLQPTEVLDDGLPQTLEEYVAECGLRFFKIKVCNDLDFDLARLRSIATIVERHRQADYGVTLDGNEQYRSAAEFAELVEAIQADPGLQVLWSNLVAIEQPLERSVALSPEHAAGIRTLASAKPIIIDESDGQLESYPRAIELGYRGVSSKSCKGVFKSLLNAGLTWLHNERGRRSTFLMTGEDLCTVGVVAVQSDLCLVATLGLQHVERNGHHYHRGLSYLDPSVQSAALQAHADFYEQRGPFVAPRMRGGQFQIGSLQCPGFGFAVEPDLESMQDRAEWQFRSLEL